MLEFLTGVVEVRFDGPLRLVQARGDLSYRELLLVIQTKNAVLGRWELTHTRTDNAFEFLLFKEFIRSGVLMGHFEDIVGVMRERLVREDKLSLLFAKVIFTGIQS